MTAIQTNPLTLTDEEATLLSDEVVHREVMALKREYDNVIEVKKEQGKRIQNSSYMLSKHFLLAICIL